MNVTNALQSGLLGVNRGLDNAPRAAGDVTGSGKTDEPELASGLNKNQAVDETAAGAGVEAASTKVVTPVESTGASGSIIDVVV
ncbi:hypothetical protein [uncultured Neptuniibacter sp.]|uniref:hypothetical protein n=1 Tax=uncultured Neptuniibacter sp. TaxID=502143 RepID=UPI00262A5A1A|nr:hypothetical protein [uncultured Neptuniibacter sp.]